MNTITASTQTYLSHEIQLVDRPVGMPRPDQFRIAERTLGPPGPGEIIVRNAFLSVDPAMRPRLSNGVTPLNAPMTGHAVGTVMASGDARFQPGDFAWHNAGCRDVSLVSGDDALKIELEGEALSAHLGALGVNGLTAYAGLFDVAQLQDGERVFVSAAAGGVGAIAAQIAKIKQCYVIGSAGSEAKCAWLRDVAGLDAVLNYSDGQLRRNLKSAAPDGIDVYFDNVGGEHLNAALPRMRMRGRIAVCGMISAYNNAGAVSECVNTLSNMMYNRLSMRGFIVWDHQHLRPQFLKDMRAWLAAGRIKAEETILDGLEAFPDALIGLLAGRNLGKMLVKLGHS